MAWYPIFLRIKRLGKDGVMQGVERQIVSGMDDELFSEDLELPTTHSEGSDVEHTA